MSKPQFRGWICALAVLGAFGTAEASGARRTAIWGNTQDAVSLVAALTDGLAKRPGVEVVGSMEAPEWFLGCTKDATDGCVEKAARAHKIDQVLRVWASRSGNKLASNVDLIDAKKGVQASFEDQGTDTTPEALHALALRAIDQLFGGKTPVAESAADAEAKAHFKAAREAYRQADYRAAIAEFEAAYKAKPSGVIRFNIAQCDEKLGDIPGALLNYHRYLHETPNAEDRATVEKAIGNLEKRLEERGVQQLAIFSEPAGAAVSVDGKPRGPSPLSIELPPGAHEVELQLAGYQTSKRKVSLAADKSVELDVALLPGSSAPAVTQQPAVATSNPPASTPAPTPAPEVKKEEGGTSGLRIASYVTGGVGVALLGVGVFENMQVSSKNSDISSGKGDIKKNYDDAKAAANVRNVGYIAGGAAVAAGVVMFFLSPDSNESGKATASISPTRDGFAAVVSGKF